MSDKMIKVKQNLTKTLFETMGQNKVCDSLAGINTAFDLLLKEQKQEFKKMVEKMKNNRLPHPTQNHYSGYNQALIDILKEINKL